MHCRYETGCVLIFRPRLVLPEGARQDRSTNRDGDVSHRTSDSPSFARSSNSDGVLCDSFAVVIQNSRSWSVCQCSLDIPGPGLLADLSKSRSQIAPPRLFSQPNVGFFQQAFQLRSIRLACLLGQAYRCRTKRQSFSGFLKPGCADRQCDP